LAYLAVLCALAVSACKQKGFSKNENVPLFAEGHALGTSHSILKLTLSAKRDWD
jgi:hypothetical protein